MMLDETISLVVKINNFDVTFNENKLLYCTKKANLPTANLNSSCTNI